jgi:putative intracellular protease/amidase
MLTVGGAVYVDQDVVTSGRIVTGSGPESARQFAVKVLALLQAQGEQ